MSFDEDPGNAECGMSVGPYNLRILQASGASNILGAHELITNLAEKARNLVALLDDAEVNHGSLIGGVTLRAIGELRLELAKWQK